MLALSSGLYLVNSGRVMGFILCTFPEIDKLMYLLCECRR